MRARELFSQYNIEYYVGIEGVSDDVVKAYINNELEKRTVFVSGKRKSMGVEKGECHHHKKPIEDA